MSIAEVQLARAEGMRLVCNPAVWAAFALTSFWAVAVDPSDSAEELYFLLAGYGLVLPAFVMMTITVLAVTRGRSSGTEGLLDTVPVGRERRTIGHGLSALVGSALGLLVMVAVLAYRRPGEVLGQTSSTIPNRVDVPRPNVAQMLQGPMAVIVFCTLAVVLARWIPSWLVMVALFIPMLAQFLFFGMWSGVGVSPDVWWWPLSSGMVVGEWVGCGPSDASCDLPLSGFDGTTPWWHLAYLAAVAVLLVAIAVLRHRRDRRTWTIFGAALGAVLTFAIVQGIVYERFSPIAAG